MADPLSITASIIAVLQLASATVGFLSEIKDGPEIRRELFEQVFATQGILYNLKCLSTNTNVKNDDMLLRCRDPIERLEATLKELVIRLKASIGWKAKRDAILWPFKKGDIERILASIEHQKSLLVLILQSEELAITHSLQAEIASLQFAVDDGLNALRTDLEALERLAIAQQQTIEEQDSRRTKRLQQAEYADIIKWLSVTPFWTRQADILRLAQPESGSWLLCHPMFQAWRDDDAAQVLWCPGIPGAGKTVLASIIIDHLRKETIAQGSAVTWVYCNYQSQSSQSVEKLLAALLSQIILHADVVPSEVRQSFNCHHPRNSRPSIDDLVHMIELQAKKYTKLFFVVDGLDECPIQDDREDLVDAIRQAAPNVHLLVTSRPEVDIAALMEGEPRVEVRAADEDLQRYTEQNMGRQLKRLTKKDPSLKKAIIKRILSAAQGMFLMAKLHLESINDMDNALDIEEALNALPQTYQGLYDEAFHRIQDRSPFQQKRAFQVFTWLTYAMEPIDVNALRHALAVSEKRTRFDERGLPDAEDLLKYCCGLVTIEPQSQIIKLVHYTAQEYLIQIRRRLFPRGHCEIASSVIRYLSYEDFGTMCVRNAALDHRKAAYPLFFYAARYWMKHVKLADAEVELREIIVAYLESKCRFAADEIARKSRNDGYAGIWQLTPFRAPGWGDVRLESPLHSAAACELPLTIKYLVHAKDGRIDATNQYGETPLHRAADTGSVAALDMLLGLGADFKTPLLYRAVRIGTPLPIHLAANGGHLKCVERLIEGGVDVDMKERHGQWTPLQLAATTNTAMVRLLIQSGANVNSVTPNSPHPVERGPLTPLLALLIFYIGDSRIERARLLIDAGCELDAQNNRGYTALHYAVTRGKNIFRCLVSRGASLYIQDNQGTSPIQLLCEVGKLSWLQDQDFFSHLTSLAPFTSLHQAIWSSDHDGAISALKANPKHATVKDGAGRTPIEYCVTSYNSTMLQAILSNPDILQNELVPIAGGDIFEHLAHVSSDFIPRAPEEWDTITEILYLLLPYRKLHNNDFSFVHHRTSVGNYNKTLLIHAAEGGQTSMCKFLIECGADVNARDVFGTSGAHYANSNVEILKLFVDHGFDIHLKYKSKDCLVDDVEMHGSDAARAYMKSVLEERVGQSSVTSR